MDPTIEWNSVRFGLKKDWLKGEFSYDSRPVDGRMPREANFFLIFYKDTDIALTYPYKAYTIDQGAAERCCSSDFTRVGNIEAYQIPEIPEIEGSESDYQEMMRKCKEPQFHDSLGVWEEEHRMSNDLHNLLGGEIESEQRDRNIKAALKKGMAANVTKHPETAHFWIGQYSTEFWDESTRRKRSGKGVTTEREIADAIFTMKKRAFRIEDWTLFGYFLLHPIYINTHWFGRTEFIWKEPEDPDADLILFMRSDNVQRELQRPELKELNDRFPLPEKTEETFQMTTYFAHQRKLEAKRAGGA